MPRGNMAGTAWPARRWRCESQYCCRSARGGPHVLRKWRPRHGLYVRRIILVDTIKLSVNGASRVLKVDDPSLPLLYALREHLPVQCTTTGRHCAAVSCRFRRWPARRSWLWKASERL